MKTIYRAEDGKEFDKQEDCAAHEAQMWRTETVSKEEWFHLETYRGQNRTGYPIHRTNDGGVYFWPWGSQNQTLARATPKEAADAFLEVYRPCPPRLYGSTAHPRKINE
jgi:hypothetical protein